MFEEQRKPSGHIKTSVQGKQSLASVLTPPQLSRRVGFTPQLQRQAQAGQQLAAQTLRPVAKQRQQAGSVFQALQGQREVVEGLKIQRSVLEHQVTEHLGPAGSLEGALQRKVARDVSVAPLTQAPSQPGDWVQAARLEVQRVTESGAPEQTRWLSGAERDRHLGALRSVGQGLAQAFRADRGPAVQRYAAYGEGLATLQRQALTGAIPRMVLAQVSPAERPHLQRAVDAAVQRQQDEEAKDASALHLHRLQRQLAALDLQAELPILERIQARKGGGVPLPASVQRQLEAGLNHDLSGVRIHTDGEADLLSKKVNAVAFTTGQDIYFQSGRFDPNSRTGIELLAHEATHAVQQRRGQVGKGIDPDAGLESEARQFGSRFSSVVNQADLHRPVSTARNPGSVPRRPTTSQLISGRLSASPIQRLSAPVLQRPGETPSPARVNSAEAGERGYVTAEQGVRLFASPHQVGGPAHSALPIIAHGTILRLLEHQDGWYKVNTASGVGYVEGQFVKVMPAGQRGLGDATKDPGAKIYKARSGDTLLGLVQQHFGLKADKETFQKRGQDMRYFANVIVAANKPEAFQDKPSLLQSLYGVTVPGGDVLGKALIAQTNYLIPSYGFALAQTKNVPSGSLSAELGKLAVHMARFTQDYGVVKNIAQQKYYGPGIKRAVLDAPGQLLEGLVQFAVLSGGVLALTTGVGAVIGAFAGGVGAAPGAAIGFEAGLALLNYVGIGFLVIYVGKQLGAFGGALMQALKLTWNAQGDAKQLDLAARALSSALETLVGVLIQALIAYLTKEGLGKLAKTPFGKQIGLAAQESATGKWLSERSKGAKTLPGRTANAVRSRLTGKKGTPGTAEALPQTTTQPSTRPEPQSPEQAKHTSGRTPAKPQNPAQAQYNQSRSTARAAKYEYDPGARSELQLQKDVNPALRTGEQAAQAQQRVQLAQEELDVRKKVAAFGEKPWRPNLVENDQRTAGHSVDRHGWNLSRQDLRDRIMGTGRWTRQESYSYKWTDEATANRTIQEHIHTNWDVIRRTLAEDGLYKSAWNTGNKVGEGFYNKNVGLGGPRQPVFGETSWVTLVLRLDPNGNPYIITAYPRGNFNE